MPYEQEIAGCLADRVGEAGLDAQALDKAVTRAAPALAKLRGMYEDGSLPILHLPAQTEDVHALDRHVSRFRQQDHVLVLGIGGSSLGGQTLTDLVAGPAAIRSPVFLDNIDPDSFDPWMERAETEDVGIIAISKSGSTAETVAQTLAAWNRICASVGRETAAKRFLVITEPGDRPLRRFADRNGILCLDHDPGVGGRFSALSIVGLLPAMIAGIDALAVRRGAQAVIGRMLAATGPSECPPAVGAALILALHRNHGVRNVATIAYSDRLRSFTRWHAQLWAESLGKSGQGMNPIPAIGAVDQHSLLQLWLDGPVDKLVTQIRADRTGTGLDATGAELDPELSYLAGRTMGDLMGAEQRATREALVDAGRPTRVFRIEAVDEERLGALMMHFMLETIMAGIMLGLNPFDQPAVENGKILARKYLSEM